MIKPKCTLQELSHSRLRIKHSESFSNRLETLMNSEQINTMSTSTTFGGGRSADLGSTRTRRNKKVDMMKICQSSRQFNLGTFYSHKKTVVNEEELVFTENCLTLFDNSGIFILLMLFLLQQYASY